MMGYGGMGWSGMALGGIGMILLWVVLIVAIVWAVTRLLPRRGGGVGPAPRQSSAEEALDLQFARGEIDLETYQTRRAVLAQSRMEDGR